MTRDPRTMWNGAPLEDEAAAGLFRPRRAGAVCPSPELVQASQMGTLPAQLQEHVARHVEQCVVCEALLEALGDPSVGGLAPDERDRIRTRIQTEIARSTPAFGLNRLWLTAAAVVAIVAIGSVLVWQSRSAPPQIARDVGKPDAPSIFQLEKPAISARTDTDLVWRGAPDFGVTEDLTRALEPYLTDDFAEAARRLRSLVSRYPQSASGHFHLGVSALFLAADAEAVAALESAEKLANDDAEMARETAWYLALAYRRTGQRERAAGKLDALCRSRSARAGQACAGLSELSRESPAPGSR
jgi:cytochrome c-type biogenesis protein CcmH/NrfG